MKYSILILFMLSGTTVWALESTLPEVAEASAAVTIVDRVPSAESKIPNSDGWQKSLSNSCAASTRRGNGSSRVKAVEPYCDCVAQNSVRLAAEEDSAADQLKVVRWLQAYVDGKLPRAAVMRDEFLVLNHLGDFADRCAKNTGYKHNFGPRE